MTPISEASKQEGCQAGNDQEDSGDSHTCTCFFPPSLPAVGNYLTLLSALVACARQGLTDRGQIGGFIQLDCGLH